MSADPVHGATRIGAEPTLITSVKNSTAPMIANIEIDSIFATRTASSVAPGFHHPCFAARLGGVSGGKQTQGWRDSSQTAIVGAGKFGSAKLPMATAT